MRSLWKFLVWALGCCDYGGNPSAVHFACASIIWTTCVVALHNWAVSSEIAGTWAIVLPAMAYRSYKVHKLEKTGG